MDPSRRTRFLIIALLVSAFVALYPYLDATGYCKEGGCPEMSQLSQSVSTGLSGVCLVAVLAAPATALAIGTAFRRSRTTDASRPEDVHLSPEPEPPRI